MARRRVWLLAIVAATFWINSGQSAWPATCGCQHVPRAGGPHLSLMTPSRCVPCPPPPPVWSGHECEFCDQLREQVLRGCSAPPEDYSPYADSLFARYPLADRFSEDARRRIMAATLAQDPGIAQEITAPLRTSAEPAERYAGNLVAAYALLRSDHPDRTAGMARYLTAMTADRDAADLPTADLSYMRAIIALDSGRTVDADAALEEALAAEPKFFGALALSTQLQLAAALRASHADVKVCTAEFRVLMARMQRVMNLSPCLTQAAHLEVFLSRELHDAHGQAAFNVVQAYLALVSRRLKFAESRVARFEKSTVTCRAPVTIELSRWLATVSDAMPAR
jgi:hypothetical protein